MPNAKARESQLWSWLKKAEPHFGERLHVERIENSAGKGTPDVFGCVDGQHFSIELKAVARTKLIHCGLSPEQFWWSESRLKAKGKHFLLIQVGSGADAKRYLIAGSRIGLFVVPCEEKFLNDWAMLHPIAPTQVFSAIATDWH